jgi:hypothetical protein
LAPLFAAPTRADENGRLDRFGTIGTDPLRIPNFASKERHAKVAVGGQEFVVKQEPGRESQLARYVWLLYLSFLGREASDADVAHQIASGLSRAQLCTQLDDVQ